jgi:hypothetical protein
MFSHPKYLASLPPGPPQLQVVVDTEEEFDWNAPFNRKSTSVTSMGAQHLTQEIYADYGIVPSYVIDYPIATTPSSIAVLRAYHDAGQCLIGTHLHPWVTPPHEEAVTTFNSYPGNLDPALERRKLEVMSAAITEAFGVRPTMYKAGRYGLGPQTIETLEALGYEIDLSVVPHTDFRSSLGPDFRTCPDRPFWCGPSGKLLEIPLSRGFFGGAAGLGLGPAMYPAVRSLIGRQLKLGFILSMSRVLGRSTLTPEGVSPAEQCELIKSMHGQGHRIFTLAYHSPSLVPGNTPYVRDKKDLQAFLDSIRRLLDFFMGKLGGKPTTPVDIRQMALSMVRDGLGQAGYSLPQIAARSGSGGETWQPTRRPLPAGPSAP